MGKTEKIGDLTEEAVEALQGRGGKVASFLWRNAFPMICGLIITGSIAWVTEMSQDHAEASRQFVYFQLETDQKFRRVEEAMHTLAAENVALRKLLTRQQVDLGITAFKVGWMHPARSGEEAPDASGPPPAPFDPAKLVAELEKRLAARSKVDPEDIARILAKRGALYEQRQMPNVAPAGGR